jgi:uncharacterized membrane-anchored protein
VTRILAPLGLAIAFVLALSGPLPAVGPIGNITPKPGPMTATLGTVATVTVPAGYQFIEQKDMRAFNELNGNKPNPNDLGAIISADGHWIVYFSFNAEGYVKDEDKDKLDADAILTAIKEGTAQENEWRRQHGEPDYNVVGWEIKPFFDDETKNLTWAIRGESSGAQNVNYEVRLLGRKGHMSVTLVLAPDQLEAARPEFNQFLKGFSYNSGEKYADFRSGDKVAEYGLAGLAAGVGVAFLAKTGVLGKLIKPIIIGVVAIFAAIGSFFKKLFGRKEATE